jgi:hypothetical protein
VTEEKLVTVWKSTQYTDHETVHVFTREKAPKKVNGTEMAKFPVDVCSSWKSMRPWLVCGTARLGKHMKTTWQGRRKCCAQRVQRESLPKHKPKPWEASPPYCVPPCSGKLTKRGRIITADSQLSACGICLTSYTDYAIPAPILKWYTLIMIKRIWGCDGFIWHKYEPASGCYKHCIENRTFLELLSDWQLARNDSILWC